MDLKKILAISGFGDLFKYISQGRNGVIVEGIEDKKRMNAYSHYKVSSLEDVAIFTESGEVPLKKVFRKIKETENGEQAIDHKSTDKKLKEYFSKILPDYDKEKVYMSDIRKVINWYNILTRNGMNDFEDEVTEEAKSEDNTENKEAV
jgi:hypothetical protein